MAVIYYRFVSQKPDHVATIKFDGTGLTVFELKREIIMVNNLIHSTDIDVILYSTEDIQAVSMSENNKEMEDDNEVVPRSTTVLVKRTMSSRKGRGNVQRYMAGKPRLHVAQGGNRSAPTSAPIIGSAAKEGTEDDMLDKVFGQQDAQWSETQDFMATATRIDNYKPALNEPVPEYYICYKCGEKGKHNIKNCPKNNDPNWEGVRVRKTTGIPKSQLKTVAKPDENGMETSANGTTAYMVNDAGNYVVAVADTKAWEQFQNTRKAENMDINNGEIDVEDGELKDTETGKLWKNPVRTPCCKKIYSRKIIEDKLIDSDFTCPNCEKEEIYLDTLEPDTELQEKIREYLTTLSENKSNDKHSVKRQQINPVGGAVNPVNMPIPPMMGMPPMNMPMMPMGNMPNMGMPPFMPFMPMPQMNNNSNNNNNNVNNNNANNNTK